MERVRELLMVKPGDFIYKSGNLSIVESIEVINSKIHFKMDDGSVIVEKLLGAPHRLEVFRVNLKK